MKTELLYTLYSVIIISLISLTGILFIINRKKFFQKFLMMLVAFSAGTMLATSFFDLIPESFEKLQNYYFVILGILFFFIMESLIHWHHSHTENYCEGCLHPYVYLNLIGDAFHNFLDGVIIASSFLINIPTGIAVSIAIIFHEIPQEIGDFAVLVHGGLTKTKALFFNFLSATTAILGAIIGYFLLSWINVLTPYIIAIAAGGFIYIAISDLFPELHKEKNLKKKLLQIGFLILGIIVIKLILIN